MTFLKKKQSLLILSFQVTYLKPHIIYSVVKFLLLLQKAYHPGLGQEYITLSVHFSSVAQSCPTLWDPMNRSTPGLPVHHQLPEFTQTPVHRVGDAIQPPHPLLSLSPPVPNSSQHQSFPMSQLFTWGGPSTGVSALASFLPKNTQDWSPLEYLKVLQNLPNFLRLT